ncbi:BTB/POZ domain-containing protein 9-like [Leptonychotes weddellii]|uniref:BTB/POZ domain-containing protein 9-like n=1 Tax=Leptonychotes weddellii TaxID=9713 RepID=A0A2U3Y0L2_LEPWE|nr:BTB/POZ domain-containing protein 9-like [Leptonychotes weddellii]
MANRESIEVQEKLRQSHIQNKEFYKERFLKIQRKKSIPIIEENLPKLKYIRIVGTHNTVNKIFHIVAFECMFTNKTFTLEKGLIVPVENVATIADCASVIEGVSRSRNALLNGDTKNYDWDSGYTCHQLGSGAIVVQLAQPYMIGSIRLLLWDCDDRSYSYYVEVSTNQQQWTMVADRTKVSCK